MRIIYSAFLIMLCFSVVSCNMTPSGDENTMSENRDEPPIPFNEIKAKESDKKNEEIIGSESEDSSKVEMIPPSDIEPIIIAEMSEEGYYIPTLDFGKNNELEKYALIISKEDTNKFSWVLCERDENNKHVIIGGGFYKKITDGIEVEEYKLPEKDSSTATDEIIALEKFGAKFSKNEIHILKSRQYDGKSSLGKLVDKYEYLYFVRILDNSEEPLATSRIVGKFHPTDLNTGRKLDDVSFNIWSNGVWCLDAPVSYLESIAGVDDSESPDRVKIKGTWKIDNNEVTFYRETKCLLDDESSDIDVKTPSETYEFVFDTDKFILWLTMKTKSDYAPVGISKDLEVNETSVFLP